LEQAQGVQTIAEWTAYFLRAHLYQDAMLINKSMEMMAKIRWSPSRVLQNKLVQNRSFMLSKELALCRLINLLLELLDFLDRRTFTG
jgi:hypothetical protein